MTKRYTDKSFRLSGSVVCLRKSMIKFETPDTGKIDIARVFDRPGAYYLNRPLIMLLEGLGVRYEVFKRYQDQAIRAVDEATTSLERTGRMLEQHGLGSSYRLTPTLIALDRLQVDQLFGSQFYGDLLQYAIHHILRDLKHHARIPIPDGVTLVGVCDVHGFLEEGEIFACVKAIDSQKLSFLEGPILISRSPVIHPGTSNIFRVGYTNVLMLCL